MTACEEKAFNKYDAAYCKKHLRRFDGGPWYYEFQRKNRHGVTVRRKLMLRGHDMDLLAAQASERIRCIITLDWNAMNVKYYTINPSLGEHIRKYKKIRDVAPRTFKQYVASARHIMDWLHGGALNDPCKYGSGKNGRARNKLIDECKISDFTIVGLRRFAKERKAKANGHLRFAACLFTPEIIRILYGEKLREPWPFVEFTSKELVVRPLGGFEEHP
jgi:hypothetical protein